MPRLPIGLPLQKVVCGYIPGTDGPAKRVYIVISSDQIDPVQLDPAQLFTVHGRQLKCSFRRVSASSTALPEPFDLAGFLPWTMAAMRRYVRNSTLLALAENCPPHPHHGRSF